MKRTIQTFQAVNCDATELQEALADLLSTALHTGLSPAGHPNAIQVQDTEGHELAEIHLQEEMLSDQSKIYNLVFRFSSID